MRERALDTESSTKYFEIPKSDVNEGEEIEVCISAVGTNDYPELTKCTASDCRRGFPCYSRIFDRIAFITRVREESD